MSPTIFVFENFSPQVNMNFLIIVFTKSLFPRTKKNLLSSKYVLLIASQITTLHSQISKFEQDRTPHFFSLERAKGLPRKFSRNRSTYPDKCCFCGLHPHRRAQIYEFFNYSLSRPTFPTYEDISILFKICAAFSWSKTPHPNLAVFSEPECGWVVIFRKKFLMYLGGEFLRFSSMILGGQEYFCDFLVSGRGDFNL